MPTLSESSSPFLYCPRKPPEAHSGCQPPLLIDWERFPRVVLVMCMRAKSLQSCLTLCDPMDCSLLGSFVHGDSPGKNTGVGCHALLQGIFPTQGLNPGVPTLQVDFFYHLSHQGSPRILEGVAYPFSRESFRPRNRTRVSCIAGGFFTS